jgi:pyruvate kinase
MIRGDRAFRNRESIERSEGMQRRAKIGATLGPAWADSSTMERILDAGVDVARLNFSHGASADHRRQVRRLRRVSHKLGKRVALLADLQGPRFRVGLLDGGALELVTGDGVDLIAGKRRSAPGTVPVSHGALVRDVAAGQSILFDDGRIALRVERVQDAKIRCEVVRGGTLRDNKGINIPGCALSVPTVTAKDRRDLREAVDLGADWLAISFVRSARDVETAKRLLRRAGRELPVMAKIERPEAVEQLEQILEVSDGLLVARGDLGVEIPPEDVPIVQKQIVEAANRAGKPVMTATQMLDSMRHNPRPTRAEASDVANAVLDGSDCLLLTAETAVGEYPVETVATMNRIVSKAEASGRTRRVKRPEGELSVPITLGLAGCRAAFEVGARYLVVFTQSGFSAYHAARFRARTPILSFSPSARVARRLQMVWGVEPHTIRAAKSLESMARSVDKALVENGLARRGDLVVVLSGSPVGVSGTTNLMKVHRVGDRRR